MPHPSRCASHRVHLPGLQLLVYDYVTAMGMGHNLYWLLQLEGRHNERTPGTCRVPAIHVPVVSTDLREVWDGDIPATRPIDSGRREEAVPARSNMAVQRHNWNRVNSCARLPFGNVQIEEVVVCLVENVEALRQFCV